MSGELGKTIASVAIATLPELFAYLKARHASTNPGAPPPTDEEMIAALRQALDSSEAVDEEWLRAHPVV